MSLVHQVLGAPGQDNLLRVDVNAGSHTSRLQFDCGDRCLDALTPGVIKATEHLFFSHLHMDHVGGFDAFFRSNFERAGRAVNVWGPPGTAAILHHRFRGFWWNIVNDVPGTWIVHDVYPERVLPHRFEAREAFAESHALEPFPHDGAILRTATYSVEVAALPHHGTSLAYLVREAPRVAVDRERLVMLGLTPGPWLRTLKALATGEPSTAVASATVPATGATGSAGSAGSAGGDSADGKGSSALGAARRWIEIDGARHDADRLARTLLTASARESVAYVTDFLLDDETFARLSVWLADIDTLVCESQYHPDETALATRNHHATIDRVAALARAARVKRLVPFHLSERYDIDDRDAMLALAKAVFPASDYPPHWRLDAAEANA